MKVDAQMARLAAMMALALLAACTSPALTANLAIGAGGVTIRPAVSTNIGGANVSVSP